MLLHLLILFLFMCLRILFVLIAGRPNMSFDPLSWTMDDDSHQYVNYAEDLLDGRQEEASVRMPLYPAFLALTWSEGHPWLLTVILQQVMGLGIGILCYLTAARFSRTGALLAGALAMLLPQHVIHSTRIMPDTLVVLLICTSGYLWIRARDAGSDRGFIALYGLIGLTLSIGVITKQVMLYSPMVYAILLLRGDRFRISMRAVALLVMTSVFLVLPLAWRSYNRAAFGLDAYSTQDAFEPLARAAILAGVTDQQSVWDGSYTASLDSLAIVDGRLDYAVRDSIYRTRTREIVWSDPVKVLLPHFTSWPKFFSVGYAHKILRSMGMAESGFPLLAWKAVLAGIYLFLLAGTVTGLVNHRVRSRMKPILQLFLSWFVFSALIYGPLATTRYGLTFFWSLIVAGSVSICILRSKKPPCTENLPSP
jgi:4-amino-4-deoxy-L-arabinose transferase-like glycosyltransferase